MAVIQVHVYVSGMVQGVFFRASTRDVAQKLGLAGWVRNLSDGRVEAVFEGDSEKIDKIIEWCHRGPEYAQVSTVETEFSAPSGEFDGFEVRHVY